MPVLRRCSSAFLAMNRASREYGFRLIGSMTSQIRNSVLCDRTGSIVAESGSGISSMSLSSIAWNPRMLEPSNPRPSVKLSTSSSPIGRLKCCHVPGRSMNRTSTTSTPSALARSITSRGLVFVPAFVLMAMNTLHEPSTSAGPDGLLTNRRDGQGADHGATLTNPTAVFMCDAHDKRYPQAPRPRALHTRHPLRVRPDHTFRGDLVAFSLTSSTQGGARRC